MSTNMSIYVGPYLQANGTYEADVETKTCTNKDCDRQGEPMQGNFCPHCGSPVGVVLIQETFEIDLCDILYKATGEDDLIYGVPYNESTYIFNDGYGKYLDDNGDTCSLSSDWLKEDFENMKKDPTMVKFFKYCIDNNITVSVDYGVINYWS